MLSKKMESALNEQMNFEFYSGYIYLAMGAYLDNLGLSGFASWMKAQNKEEIFHVDKIYKYLLETGGRPFYTEVPEPPKEWDNIKAVFKHALEHEKVVTGRINNLMSMAIKENDYATRSLLTWYIDEQVEEESSVKTIVDKLELINTSEYGIFMLDKELGARVFSPPAQ